jgi:hypothetical protein
MTIGDRTRRDLHVVLLTAAAMAVAACSPADRACTAMGCQSGATISLSIGADRRALAGATLEVCRNGSCVTGTLQEDPADGSFLAGSSGGGATVFATASPGAARYSFQIQYLAAAVSDGDVYRVRLTTAAGQGLADSHAPVASYAPFYPNGPDCDPRPCRTAVLTL